MSVQRVSQAVDAIGVPEAERVLLLEGKLVARTVEGVWSCIPSGKEMRAVWSWMNLFLLHLHMGPSTHMLLVIRDSSQAAASGLSREA